jgi:hypothetical protein
VGTSARLVNGLLLQAGLDSGTLTQDVCEVRAKLPEWTITDVLGPYTGPTNPYCHSEQPLTQFKMLGSYTVPKVALQVSATLQEPRGTGNPGELPGHRARRSRQTLGRNLAAGAGANVTVIS